ncbi:MAG: hypothetical protein P8H92_00525, partial [Paracoccaceae bacterium]|nr:hypothetical protein [Paracoccaceae bacterium]
RMVQIDGFKYAWHNRMDDELFDLQRDPAEVTNLANSHFHQDKLVEMRSILDQFLGDTNDPLLGQWREQRMSNNGIGIER